MTCLAQQQQHLLQALFSRAAPPVGVAADAAGSFGADANLIAGARGLAAYRSNSHVLAERTLLAAYPVISQLLGLESFQLLARDFWQQHPPALGDLAQWGQPLAGFLQASDQLASEPYLADVARVEWLLHLAVGAADSCPDPASFALLSSYDPDALTLKLSTGVAVISSPYPVASIVTAHMQTGPTLQEVGEKLRAGTGEHALVWRQGFRPRVAACSAAEATFVQSLQSGASLLSALERAPGLDFPHWLPAAVQSGLVLGACQAEP